MSVPTSGVRVPAYRLHKARNCAVVTIAGRNYYLGPYDSPESREKYHRLVYEHLSGSSRPAAQPTSPPALSINELILRYWTHVESYYRKDGRPTSEVHNARTALSHLRTAYEHLPTHEFTPLCLDAVRTGMLASGRLSRTTINRYCDRIRAMFKWGVSRGHVPVEVYQALLTLDRLKKGRSAARETEPVRPVPWSAVEATLPHLTPVVQDLVRLQHLLGARPGEVCSMRPCDLDRSDPAVWVYTPASHKTQHHDKGRSLYLGPKAQAILRPYLDATAPDGYVFSPRASLAQHNAARSAARRSPLTPSQRARARRTRSEGRAGVQFDKDAYRQAIQRACDRAFPHPTLSALKKKALSPEQNAELKRWRSEHHWHPNQLRHTRATELRRKYGVEAVKILLGHGNLSVTEIYAERDLAAVKAMMVQEA